MDDNLIFIIKKDIERCNNQTEIEGSENLYFSLIGKYDGIFENFSSGIPKIDKLSLGSGPLDYRVEINAIKEKLEVTLISEQVSDPLYKFKSMISEDIEKIRNMLESEDDNGEEKNQLYIEITAKYHSYVPDLGAGLYCYYENFYDEVTGESLDISVGLIQPMLVGLN